MDLKQTKLQIETYVDNGVFLGKVEYNQKIEFMYDENMKGSIVGMTLTSDTFINAPNLMIMFKNQDLKKILEFLIESEKPKRKIPNVPSSERLS